MKSLIKLIILASSLALFGCYDGAIYAMNNSAEDNSILVYHRDGIDGTLTFIGSESTGGKGTGIEPVVPGPGAGPIDPLASNYAVIMSDDYRFLFAVNAGSNEISSFKVNKDKSLDLVSIVPSGGKNPVSLAVSGKLLYVANIDGGNSKLVGFKIGRSGKLTQLDDSERVLTGRTTAIRFTGNKKHLIATEINTQRLQVFGRRGYNLSKEPTTYNYPVPQEGRNVANPFGLDTFSIKGEQYAVVGEARVFNQDGEADPQGSSVSTFKIGRKGALTPISEDIGNSGQIALCWVMFNQFNNLFIGSNTGSENISTFDVFRNGSTALSDGIAFQESIEPRPGLTDLFTVSNFVYQMYSAEGTVVAFKINQDGSLTEVSRNTDLAHIGGNQGITGF